MDLSHIRYFLNLAETLNFTEAAKLSGVTQPTLTRAIQPLEDELGGLLLYRDGKDTRLTALGREIRGEFANIAGAERRIRASVESRVRGKHEVLNIGLVHSLAPTLISRFLTHALTQMPLLEIVLHSIGQDNAKNLVLVGTLDGAFVSDADHDNSKLSILDLFEERLYVALSFAHRLTPLQLVSAVELAEEDYIDRLNCELRIRAGEQLMHKDVVMQPPCVQSGRTGSSRQSPMGRGFVSCRNSQPLSQRSLCARSRVLNFPGRSLSFRSRVRAISSRYGKYAQCWKDKLVEPGYCIKTIPLAYWTRRPPIAISSS